MRYLCASVRFISRQIDYKESTGQKKPHAVRARHARSPPSVLSFSSDRTRLEPGRHFLSGPLTRYARPAGSPANAGLSVSAALRLRAWVSLTSLNQGVAPD